MDDDYVLVHEFLVHIAPPDVEQESTHMHKNVSFFKRITSGNMIHSGKKKCAEIIKSTAGGSQNIGHKAIQKGMKSIEGENV